MYDNSVILVPTYEDYGIEGTYLGERIHQELQRLGRNDIELVYARVVRFRDSSQKVVIKESVRGKNVYIIHPTYTGAAEHAFIGAQAGQAAKMGDAERVILFDLYQKYIRQDRRTDREPVTARLIAELYELAGIDHVFTLDAHVDQIQMAFSSDCPIETLPTTKLVSDYLRRNYNLANAAACSPDTGGVKRVRSMANYLGLPMVIIHKKRSGTDQSEVIDVIGNVEGKDVYIRDDVTTTGGTLMNAGTALKEIGAREIYAVVTHLDIDDETKEKMKENGIKIITTNTVPQEFTEEEKEQFDVIDVAPLIALLIHFRSEGRSIAKFFDTKGNNFD
ncbi:MAG: ribose-phosphate diphosphokinase [Candidatus Aenigmarchaeota archaeon]|nr:ribose-phosphate diphosphokinase [Candidatus Aenigmarchaeota archaeon]